MSNRALMDVVPGMPTSDGDGVKLTRIIGSPRLDMLDPFLLLDCFESDQAQDYIGGFPDHPHRGFETVTYLLNGRMRHKDSSGQEGVIEPGGVQWMTAGSGIIHSEMPEQEAGLLKGFQLWVNLPASAKMMAPGYQEFPKQGIPVEHHENGTTVSIISGQSERGTKGPVINEYVSPIYMDINLPDSADFTQPLPDDHNAFVYVIEGAVTVENQSGNGQTLREKQLGILTRGDSLTIKSEGGPSRALLIAGKPLNEPVARGGPFVMNTREEVLQAFEDFRRGRFLTVSPDAATPTQQP